MPLPHSFRVGRAGAAGTSIPIGEAVFTTQGTYAWVVPGQVTSVSIIAVAKGQDSNASGSASNPPQGGNGGGLGYSNSIPVSGGDTINVTLGNPSATVQLPFAASQNITIAGENYTGYSGGGTGGSFGSVSGSGGSGGGGAGGYGGNGGRGGTSFSNTQGSGTPGTGGTNGAGGGGGGGAFDPGGAGGSVGIYGQGTAGTGGTGSRRGNAGQPGSRTTQVGGTIAGYPGIPGVYGGGAAGVRFTGTTSPDQGAVRIVWSNTETRSFPSTNVTWNESGGIFLPNGVY